MMGLLPELIKKAQPGKLVPGDNQIPPLMSPDFGISPPFMGRPVPPSIQPLPGPGLRPIEYPDYSEKFDVFEDRLGGFGEQLGSYGEQITGFGEQVSGIESLFSNLENRLGAIEQGIASLKEQQTPGMQQNYQPFSYGFSPMRYSNMFGLRSLLGGYYG